MTRMALAAAAGISDATIGYLETQQRIPALGTLLRLADALSISAAWLAFGFGDAAASGEPNSAAGMGERLHTARTERRLSKLALAAQAKLTSGAILGIERGGQAGVDTVEALAKVLRVSPAWLAFGIGPRELPPRRRAASAAVGR